VGRRGEVGMHEGGWELPGKRRGREFATDHEEASRFSSSKLILLSLFYSYLPSEPPPERASTIWALHREYFSSSSPAFLLLEARWS